MKTAAVFLDRDGVVNRAILRNGRPHPPSDLSELVVLPGVERALARLRDAGFRLIVVTNQPDVARGRQCRAATDAIHEYLLSHLPLDAIRACFHDDVDQCGCRKPKPGLLVGEGEDVDFSRSYMIGDRWRDIQAGRAAGCRTIFIDHGYAEERPLGYDQKVGSLAEAADWICGSLTGEGHVR